MVKIVFNDVKSGKSYQKEFELELFRSMKIGDKVNGDTLGLKDYEFEITGGSDNAGFPLSKSFDAMVRKRILVEKGKRKGGYVRKNVRGNYFGDYMAQINLKTLKYGSVDLMKGLGVEEKVKEGEVPAEQKKEVKKAEVKPEAPKVLVKVEEKK
jgi:small subunit ribosomal protein S6e